MHRPADHTDPDGAGQRLCARGDWCADPRIIRNSGGPVTRLPALTPRAYCDADRAQIVRYIGELPSAYGRLAAQIGERPNGAQAVRVPFGPSEPVRAEVDALMRVIAVTLPSWESRVRSSRLRLEPRDPGLDVHTRASVTAAAATMGTHIDVLLALEPGWMSRTYTFPAGKPAMQPAAAALGRRRPSPPGAHATCRRCRRRISRSPASDQWFLAEQLGIPAPPCTHEPTDGTAAAGRTVIPPHIEELIGEREIIRQGDGWVTVQDLLSGADAGEEIARLHYRARVILGETRAQPETLDGVPCRSCEAMALERAEPPARADQAAMHSRCAACGHTMDRTTFLHWAAWYAGWADRANLTCKRCQNSNCAGCTYGRCACAAQGHWALRIAC